jgi:hypothetical protein
MQPFVWAERRNYYLNGVRIPLVALIVICYGCSGTLPKPTGHYVLESHDQQGRYLTLDIQDSMLLLNKSLIFQNQRDTIFIDTKRSIVRNAESNELHVYALKAEGDTVVLSYGDPDDASSDMVFVRSTADPQRDLYSNSFLDVQLDQCEGNGVDIEESGKFRHLLIGRPKAGLAASMMMDRDSIVMEFHNMTFIGLKDVSILAREMKKAGEHLCVHIDKETPDAHVLSLRAELSKHAQGMKILEGRMKEGRVVYVDVPGQSANL